MSFITKFRYQRGEIASLLTIASMVVLTIGIIAGARISRQESPIQSNPQARTVQTNRDAETAVIASPSVAVGTLTPTPVDLGYTGGRWFRGSTGLTCRAEFTCGYDPIIRKLELRSLDGTKVFELGKDATKRGKNGEGVSPIGAAIDSACGGGGIGGIFTNWDPRREFTQKQIDNYYRYYGYRINSRTIFVTVRQSAVNTELFLYEAPEWLTGADDVHLYFEFDAQTAKKWTRYAQKAKGKGGCAPATNTPTPTPELSVTPTVTLPVSPTPTDPVTTIPLPTETPTPPITSPVSCEFKALSYLQECVPDTHGQCPRDANGNFIAKPINVSTLPSWGTSNNHQIERGEPIPRSKFKFLDNNSTERSTIMSHFPYYTDARLGNQLSYIMYTTTVPVPNGVDPLKPGPAISIGGYDNFESAAVRLTLPRSQYRVVPDGNEIKFCKNTIVGNYIGACDTTQYLNSKVNTAVDALRDPRDTIAGLTLGCGQNIVYGWTVQKCQSTFDYVFVMDVSTTMSMRRDIHTGKLKKDAALAELNDFLTDIKNSGGNSRAALIQFSSRTNTRTVTPLTDNIDTVINAANNSLTYIEGTCIECGLREATNLLTNFRTDKSRNLVVIVLTDGLPNSDPGSPRPGGYEEEIRTEANRIKNLHNTIPGMDAATVIGIGYGDPSQAEGPDISSAELMRVIKSIATNDSWAYSTTTRTSIHDIFTRISENMNTCDIAATNYFAQQVTKDLNDDGIINTVDLLAIYDAYYKTGENIKEDINKDGTVNALDISLIVNDLGTLLNEQSDQ